jgi:N-acetylated-alpha-linked acidic dipeptidase
MQRRWPAGILGLALGMTALAAPGRAADGPLGFSPRSREAHLAAEARALAVPTPEKARSWLRTLTEEPHVAGTPADHDTAIFVRDKLRDWGWSADLAEYEVMLNYPVSVQLRRDGSTGEPLKVIEDRYDLDKDSASPEAFPAFHGYGTSGSVTGQLVYANYGRPEDFDTLERMGVEVKGKIVIVRYYGGLFRGLKVLNAQKRGAVGMLIYSDPIEDGYGRGDPYPVGPYRPPSGIQRGSVQFLSLGPGDPSTPLGPSTKGARRLPIDPLNGFPLPRPEGQIRPPGPDPAAVWEQETGLKRAEYFATIPSLPISYEAAHGLLQGLGGPVVPNGWQGGLPFAYHCGPGPQMAYMSVVMDYQVRTIWNVIAKLPGAVEPDRWVMIGNHRDAWVYGAVDPGSGTAATLETCRALGEAVQAGWKPRRTLVYASWDAEEYGLVGSTEWAEDHAEELDAKAVLMLNVDSAVSGPDLDLDGIPSMRDLVLDAASAVNDPRTGRPLRQKWTAARRASWANEAPVDLDDRLWADEDYEPRTAPRFSPQMSPLGSGSDYTVFVDHLGIPAADVNFSGRYGVYHSVYDDFFWMERFCDPDFTTHAVAARLYTAIAMRAAGADVVPLTFVPYGEALRSHVDDLRRAVARKARASDKPRITFEGLEDLARSIRTFQEQAAALDRATAALASRDDVPAGTLSAVNDALRRVERAFLSDKGLPGRNWFKHTIYAPALPSGYASWPLPGIHQAIAEDDPRMLAEQGPILIRRIDAATAAMKAAEDAARS